MKEIRFSKEILNRLFKIYNIFKLKLNKIKLKLKDIFNG